MKSNMQELLLSLLQSYDELLNCRGNPPEDPHPPLAKEFFSVKSQSTKYKLQKTFPTTAGESEHNIKKNRYKDILPFDSTRVTLSEIEGVPGSNYINANYLKGHDGRPVYIAAQGPLPQTVIDFWRLIWESNTEIIVMACNEYELGKHKCQKYWSEENETLQFGEITVQQISQECITKDFLIRKLHVSKGEAEKELFQFHYTSWPDHGVPTSVEAIINMVKKMRDYQVDGNMPLLIHCSAGCGRTGTICVIDFIRNLLRDEMIDQNFSLKSIILEMRKQRHAIVQTKEQYELVHKAAAALFREALQDKYGMTFGDGHTYENWTLDHELVPRSDAQRNVSQPTQQPEVPRKSQPSDADSSKVNMSLKPVKPFKPPILSTKPTSPLPAKQSMPPLTRSPDFTTPKVGKLKHDALPVSPAPTQRRSYDSIIDNMQGPKISAQRLSETDSKIAGVQNLLLGLQQSGNLTGGLKTRPELSKRISTELKKPPESPKPQTDRKPVPRTLPPTKVHQPARNTSSSGYEVVSLNQTSSYEVVQTEPVKKMAPNKPRRNEHNIQVPRKRSSFPPLADNPAPKSSQPTPRTPSLGNGEYAYVDHKSHLNELIERERESGTVESAAYESVDLDPNYKLAGQTRDDVVVPYAYTDIDGGVPKSDVRKPQRNSAIDRAYEDVNPQVNERPKPAARVNLYVNEDSAYAEVGDFEPPPQTRASSHPRLISENSTASSNSGWSYTDDSFDDDEEDIPVVPQRTREMYQTIEEIEDNDPQSGNTTKKLLRPFATLNKILKSRPKLPDFNNPPLTAQSQQRINQQQQQHKVGEHNMELNEAIRSATFATRDTFIPGPITYENIDISFPRKVPKPKPPKPSPPWREAYSLHYH